MSPTNNPPDGNMENVPDKHKEGDVQRRDETQKQGAYDSALSEIRQTTDVKGAGKASRPAEAAGDVIAFTDLQELKSSGRSTEATKVSEQYAEHLKTALSQAFRNPEKLKALEQEHMKDPEKHLAMVQEHIKKTQQMLENYAKAYQV